MNNGGVHRGRQDEKGGRKGVFWRGLTVEFEQNNPTEPASPNTPIRHKHINQDSLLPLVESKSQKLIRERKKRGRLEFEISVSNSS